MIIDSTPRFKPGDPPPEGYLAWHEWAKVQFASGRRQRRCFKCSLWMFPQELSDGNVCKACEANSHAR